jgi:hypothetical protein
LPVYERLGDVRSRALTMGRIADVLEARGELEEALRIHREEELPIYERLGDARLRAITMARIADLLGQIADVLEDRGELDEALRIHREEELPVYEQLGDLRETSVVLQKIATALIKAGGIEQGRIQEIHDALAEAFVIARDLQLPDGIANVGIQLAQILALGDRHDEALQVLGEAEKGFRQLNHAEGLEAVQRLRQTIAGRADG